MSSTIPSPRPGRAPRRPLSRRRTCAGRSRRRAACHPSRGPRASAAPRTRCRAAVRSASARLRPKTSLPKNIY